MGSNDSSPLHTRSPKSEDPSREEPCLICGAVDVSYFVRKFCHIDMPHGWSRSRIQFIIFIYILENQSAEVESELSRMNHTVGETWPFAELSAHAISCHVI